ncbi:putative Vacuolar-sorting protein SNF8 [Blattamonas nauphoetae]|uniref:Vacuolar-sorting protein SNF8 n=1 Tax=Blattamonas nauphoetae TaxID=2049346 RepID=A0ABQ9XTB3_9EUKA|nr:putative Vacuolar-sorting protein SNF8 [Blattamonas nauphoetae]
MFLHFCTNHLFFLIGPYYLMAHRNSALQKRTQNAAKQKAKENVQQKMIFLKEQLDLYKQKMLEFAQKNKKDILQRPDFRQTFQNLCKEVQIDPLLSSKGIWAELLGIGDFYYELSVQIVDVCISTRSQNGGLIEMREMKHRLEALRHNTQQISFEDITKAIEKLQILNSGYKMIKIGNQTLIQSIPNDLNPDQQLLMQLAQKKNGNFTLQDLNDEYRWNEERAKHTLDPLLKEGFVMIDTQDPRKVVVYWVVGLCSTT